MSELKAVIEFTVPFLVDKNIAVSRTKIRRFLKDRDVSDPISFRKAFDAPEGLMNNFCKLYAGK